MQYTSVNSLLPISGTASLQAAVYDQGEQKVPGTAGWFIWQSGKTQNSTTYYYNPSGAREQEEFLLEYKFLHLFLSVGMIVKFLTMCRSFLRAA
jgi:hypothetical protein